MSDATIFVWVLSDTTILQAYDVRYASFSVVDLNPPGPVLHTVSDDEFRSAYHKLYGAMKWEAVFGRNVSLIVARNHQVLERCGVDASESFVVELEDQTPVSVSRRMCALRFAQRRLNP